jgi:hypothetical protein
LGKTVHRRKQLRNNFNMMNGDAESHGGHFTQIGFERIWVSASNFKSMANLSGDAGDARRREQDVTSFSRISME